MSPLFWLIQLGIPLVGGLIGGLIAWKWGE